METNTAEAFRMSPQQCQLWLVQRDSRAFRAQVIVQLDGLLAPDALEAAVERVVARHEVFRTTFRTMPGVRSPFQVIGAAGRAAWRGIDWTSRAREEWPLALERLAAEERHRPFDLEHGPVLHLCLVETSPRAHVLVATAPGLCADAVTMINLAREIAAAYAADAREEHTYLQYADFSAWANELLESDDIDAETARTFWGRDDRRRAATLPLPFESSPQSGAPFDPRTVVRAIDPSIAQAMRAAAQRSGVSIGAWFLAAWQTLLWRLGATSDDVVVTRFVSHGRKFDETRHAMGLFAKAVPIQGRPDGTRPFTDFARALQERIADAEAWQEYFIDRGGDEAGEGDAPRSVDFECIERPDAQERAGLSVAVSDVTSCTAPFKLRLTTVGRADDWTMKLQYASNVLRPEHVERMATSLEVLFAGAAERPEAGLAELPVLDDTSRHDLVSRIGLGSRRDWPASRVDELFDSQADRTPSAVAVICGAQQMTFGELRRKANQLARWLAGRGVGPGGCVGLCVDRSVDMIVGLLGIIKAGAAYVPLSPDHPTVRIAHQLAETGAPVIVTEERYATLLAGSRAEILCLDREGVLPPEDEREPLRVPDVGDLVYVLYTSGSTGAPKGVAVTHANLLNYTCAICECLGVSTAGDGPRLAFATVSTLAADLGNTAIFPSLVSGGCLHIVSYADATDARAFADYMRGQRIDVLKIVPSHLEALLACGEDVESLLPARHLVLGGEALSWPLAERLLAAPGDRTVYNHYGPTETTVGSLVYRLERGTGRRADSRTAPIGRPLANTRIYVLDERGAPVPPGAPGELYIGGAGVAAGYVSRPDLTAERFVADPFGGDPRARLYKTGDRVRYLADEQVEFLGRYDDQVKIRGFRIELGEIAAVLTSHPDVREAIAVVREDGGGDKQLVAYWVPSADARADADDLRRALRERVPEYMMPSAFVPLRALPLTRNGKVDRHALPEPEQKAPVRQRPFEAPRTPIEIAVASLWAELLKQERVGLHDNFFELGGHSLLVTQVVSRLRGQFDVALSLRTVFEHPTVAGVALAIAQESAERQDPAALDPVLAELDRLSDEDAERMLDARRHGEA